ncbi:hypothetical protein BJ166DRAFT_253619 [Pestalotiopsis sp. NC0098]|nr:hypothetical protein BJ166DRAFT_253619 [Pestalotiopsis sp. NC0098]
MATDFIMPRLPDQQQQPYGGHFYMPNPHVSQQQQRSTIAAAQSQAQAQFQLQQQQMSSAASSRQISPLSTSNSTSPTSPKSYHTRQLRPLYIPAVLRPTDYPAKKTPTVKKTDDDDDSLKASSSWSSLTGLGAFGRLARRGTGDSGKCLNGELDMDMFPKPTAEPTRTHWKDDNDATICDEPSCRRHFNYWTRRHHCRKCGNIFCDSHSNYDVPLDQDANYNPRGTPSRACSHCHTEFEVWCSRTNSAASSDDGSSSTSGTAPASPITASGTPTAVGGPGRMGQNKAEVAASVPRDWNWSTF